MLLPQSSRPLRGRKPTGASRVLRSGMDRGWGMLPGAPQFFSQQAQLLDSWPRASHALSTLKRPNEAQGRTLSRLRALGAS